MCALFSRQRTCRSQGTTPKNYDRRESAGHTLHSSLAQRVCVPSCSLLPTASTPRPAAAFRRPLSAPVRSSLTRRDGAIRASDFHKMSRAKYRTIAAETKREHAEGSEEKATSRQALTRPDDGTTHALSVIAGSSVQTPPRSALWPALSFARLLPSYPFASALPIRLLST